MSDPILISKIKLLVSGLPLNAPNSHLFTFDGEDISGYFKTSDINITVHPMKL